MLFKDYINYEINILQEQVIGREITIADTPVLLLGMQECHEEPEEPGDCVRLYLIYEDEPDEPDWDEEPDFPEKVTRRQAMMEAFTDPDASHPHVTDIRTFLINGEQYPTFGMTNGPLEVLSYQEGHMIHSAAKAGKLPSRWLEIDERRIWCAMYLLDMSAFGIDWNSRSFSFNVIMETPNPEFYVGKKFTFSPGSPGQKQEPLDITILDPDGDEKKVTVHGLRMETIPEWNDEEEKHILCLQYEAPENLYMHFYRTEYLDGPLTDHESVVGAMALEDGDSRIKYDYLDFVPEDFHGPTEIELFSYTLVIELGGYQNENVTCYHPDKQVRDRNRIL